MADVLTGADSASSTFADEIGQLFSDFATDGSSDDETPTSSSEDAAGSPPAERQPDPDETHQTPEGDPDAERTGTPPADAANQTPDVAPPEDPLAGSTPFAYTVNGQSRPVDGITVLGDKGAIVTPEGLKLIQQRFSERDNLHEQDKARYQRTQQLERLTEWTRPGADGKPETVRGEAGVAALRESHDSISAKYEALVSYLDDPQNLVGLIQGVDEAGKIVLDPRAIQQLSTHIGTAAKIASYESRSQLAQQLTRPEPQGPKDYTSNAAPTITALAGDKAQHLSLEDRAFLTEQFPLYVVDSPNGATVNPAFQTLVQRMATASASRKSEAAAIATASAENTRRLAAAALGQKPVQRAPTPRREPTPTHSRATDADQAWALMERMQRGA